MNIEIFVTCFLLFGGHFKKIKKKSDGVGIFEINWVSFDDYALPLTQWRLLLYKIHLSVPSMDSFATRLSQSLVCIDAVVVTHNIGCYEIPKEFQVHIYCFSFLASIFHLLLFLVITPLYFAFLQKMKDTLPRN